MINLSDSNLFTPVTHPESGVTIHVLTRRVAPVQQGFYFVNDSMSADGRYLWFYCAFPPALHRTLAVIDFVDQTVRHFPETSAAGAYVDPDSGDVFWSEGATVWRRGPREEDIPVPVNQLPSELVGGRHVASLASHLTRSADGKELFINASVGLAYLFGSLPLDGGPFELWWRFDRLHNHAQFSPTDPDTALFAQEFHTDPITGLRFPITNRLWLITRGDAPRPILREPRFVSHEWWDPDGEHVWCVDVGNNNETWRVRIADGEVERIAFPRQCWHSHSSRGELAEFEAADRRRFQQRFLSRLRLDRPLDESRHRQGHRSGRACRACRLYRPSLPHRSTPALLLRRPIRRFHYHGQKRDRPGDCPCRAPA